MFPYLYGWYTEGGEFSFARFVMATPSNPPTTRWEGCDGATWEYPMEVA